jgi:hypothetical protein
MSGEQDEPIPQPTEPDKKADVRPEAIKLVQAAMAATLKPYFERMRGGLLRVVTLVVTAKAGLKRGNPRDKTTAEDILRAAVVLNHAHLEDFLRTIASTLLPAADESRLNEIPLKGQPGRPEKFFLGKLVHYRGKLVDDVLRESVSEYLDRRTFNDTDEISQILGALGVDVSKVNEAYPAIQQMMKRRHQIVHRADRIQADDPEILEPISPDEVELWMEATKTFVGSLLGEIVIKLPIEDAIARKLQEELAALKHAETSTQSGI